MKVLKTIVIECYTKIKVLNRDFSFKTHKKVLLGQCRELWLKKTFSQITYDLYTFPYKVYKIYTKQNVCSDRCKLTRLRLLDCSFTAYYQ